MTKRVTSRNERGASLSSGARSGRAEAARFNEHRNVPLSQSHPPRPPPFLPSLFVFPFRSFPFLPSICGIFPEYYTRGVSFPRVFPSPRGEILFISLPSLSSATPCSPSSRQDPRIARPINRLKTD